MTDAKDVTEVLREFGWCGWCEAGICSGDKCQRQVHEKLATALIEARAERDAAYDARRNADIYARRYEEQAMSAEQTIAAARGTRLDAAGERQLRELVEERTELCKTVAFFASVIKSGESWSDTCQTMYNNTIIHLPSRK